MNITVRPTFTSSSRSDRPKSALDKVLPLNKQRIEKLNDQIESGQFLKGSEQESEALYTRDRLIEHYQDAERRFPGRFEPLSEDDKNS